MGQCLKNLYESYDWLTNMTDLNMTTNYATKPKPLLKSLLVLSLFPLFFILHGYNENFGLIPFSVLLGLFVKYLTITAGVFLLSFLILRSAQKALVFSFYCLAVYFFFGFFHDLISRILHGSFFASYKFILSLILVVSFFLLVIMKRSSKNFIQPARYVTYLLILLAVFEFFTFGNSIISKKAAKNNLVAKSELNTSLPDSCSKEKPDIFFIVLDEYASTDALRKFFGYDNSAMDSFFVANGFYISDGSKSNYNFTPFSLASTLNYEYLDLDEADSLFPNTKLLQGIETFKNNKLTSFLRQQGYDILNYGCFDLDNTDLETYADFQWLPKNMIDKQTLFSRIRDDIGWQLQTKNIFTGEFKIPKSYWEKKERHLHRNNYNFQQLINELGTTKNKPRFIYAHLMLPHEPYYLDSLGNQINDTAVYMNYILPEKGYFDQLAFCNKLLREIISSSVANSEKQKVIIIEGDHGIRFHNQVASKEMPARTTWSDGEFYNLNAYYFSDRDYQHLYKTISPVNSFRVILNKYFCGNFPMLKDSSFYMRQKGRY